MYNCIRCSYSLNSFTGWESLFFVWEIDGDWSDFGEWSDCSAQCGDGTSTRERTCTNPEPQGVGENCSGDFTEEQPCNDGDCGIHSTIIKAFVVFC